MSKRVSALTIQARSKDRINVFLDGEFAFSLHIRIADCLTVDQELTEDDMARLLHEDECIRAYQKAVEHLAGRPRSRAEIERHLSGKRFSPQAIVDAIAVLSQQNLVNDVEFARFWTENRTRFRPRSAHALRYELRQKGVASDEIDAALENIDDEEAAWAALQPKLRAWSSLTQEDFDKKAQGFLLRRGFGFDTIRTTLRRVHQEAT